MIELSNAEYALKNIYLPVLAEQLNTTVNPLLAQIEQTTQDVWGDQIRKPVSYGINGGISAGTETGDLPMAGGNKYEQFVLNLKNLYGVIEITDKAINASQSSNGAFVNLLDKEMESLLKASRFNFGRMLFGDGRGVIGTIQSYVGRTLTLDTTQYVTEGMIVDVRRGANNDLLFGGRTITSVDRTTNKITIDGSTFASGVFVQGDYVTVQGSFGNEITGLGAIFDLDQGLYELDRDYYKWMRPQIYSSQTISDVVIQRAIDDVDLVSGSAPNFIVCSNGVRRAYQDYLTTNRTCVDVVNLTGGFKAITYNGIPVVADRFCQPSTMYLLNTNDFALHQLCDWRWLEGNNGKILAQVAGKPIYRATLVKYADLLCDHPSGQAVINDIEEL